MLVTACYSIGNTHLLKAKTSQWLCLIFLVLFFGRVVGWGGGNNGNAVSSVENSLCSQGSLKHVLHMLGKGQGEGHKSHSWGAQRTVVSIQWRITMKSSILLLLQGRGVSWKESRSSYRETEIRVSSRCSILLHERGRPCSRVWWRVEQGPELYGAVDT